MDKKGNWGGKDSESFVEHTSPQHITLNLFVKGEQENTKKAE